MAGSSISSLVDFSQRPFEFYAVRIFVLMCLIPILWMGRIALNTFARTKPQPLITLATFVAALFTTSYLFDAMLLFTGFTDEPQGTRRLMTNALGFFTILIITSLLVTYAREFARKNSTLVATATHLIETRQQASERIAHRQAELISTIQTQINVELSQIQGKDATTDSQHMRKLIDNVVRPISYSLARNLHTDSSVEIDTLNARVQWSKVTAHAFTTNPFHAISVALMMSTLAVPFLIANFQTAGWNASGILALSLGIFSYLSRLAWKVIPQSWTIIFRAIIFTVTNALIALVSAQLITFFTGFIIFEPIRMTAWVVISNLAAWTVALVWSVFDLLRKTNSELSSSVDELKREVISLNGAYRQLQTGISRALHGPVQEAITSALIKLQSTTVKVNPEELAQDLRKKITASLEVLSFPSEKPTDIIQVLEDVKELWSDTVEITYKLTNDDLATLSTYPWTAHIITELAREACSNAIRHGDAREINISLEVDPNTESVALEISNYGSPLPEDLQEGLGSQLFDDVTLEWSREQAGPDVVVKARVPMSSPASI
jgi:two-component sensor histidine kinase